MIVPLYRHNLINEDTSELATQFGSLLSNMIISTGPINKEVSNQFAAYVNRKHCILTSNWSSGMMATLIALGIGHGDEVIVPALTFAATANIVEAIGATPVFVDIDVDTKLMNIEQAAQLVTKKTKAIIPVHLYGQMLDVKKLKFALPKKIFIIEDAAHAIEAEFAGDRPGTHSDAAVFSFYQSKNMTTGEGGAIVTDNDDLYDKIKVSYRHGINLCGYQRHIREEFIAPDVTALGIKANMPDLLAILLPHQIKKAEKNLALRQTIADRYLNELAGLVEVPYVTRWAKHAWHIFAIGISPLKREQLLIDLFNRGIKTTIHFKSLHTTSYYAKKYNFNPNDFPIAYQWGESVFSLPIFPGLTNIEQDYVINNLKELL